ncbi:Hypp1864 [Branchiostoma lanceolatum]|uniref:Hypp1864 protein n=1 Tax=Branchiostoma lanceolatum TaxID=7740 RepID=A0A8K0EQR6_BRALA|nr:Hypp1864 [Branchiostoma lanceolatum]
MEEVQEDLKVPEWFQQYRHAHQRQLSYKGKAQRLRRSLLQQNQQSLSYALERVRQVEFSGKHAVKPEQDFQLGASEGTNNPQRNKCLQESSGHS